MAQLIIQGGDSIYRQDAQDAPSKGDVIQGYIHPHPRRPSAIMSTLAPPKTEVDTIAAEEELNA